MQTNRKPKQRAAKHEGTLYQRRDGRWAASISVRHTGNARSRPTVYARTRAEAQRKLAGLRMRYHVGPSSGSKSGSLGVFLEAWLNSLSLRETSRDLYTRVVGNHILPYLGHLPLSKITPQTLKQHASALHEKKVSPFVTRQTYDTLRWALTAAVKQGLLSSNPCDAISRPRAIARPKVFLNERQIQRFLQAAEQDRLYAMYVLAITFGLRQGELFGLSDDDIDWEAGKLTIRRSLHLVRGRRTLGEPKTEASIRTIRLSRFAMQALHRHLAILEETGWSRDRRLFPQKRGPQIPLLFLNQQGEPLHRPAVRQHSFKPIICRAGLPDFRFHDMRHTAASFFLSKGYSVLSVSRLLGHSKASTTLNVYGHLIVDDRQRMANELDRLHHVKVGKRK